MNREPGALNLTPTQRPARPGHQVSLRDKVAFLSDPTSYPGSERAIQRVQTHMSLVFLTEAFAYKLKKPVRLSFLDFGTLERRCADCRREVRLNRRLAPDVYLGVIELTRSSAGKLSLGGTGEAVDCLVKMRRLPRDEMLDAAIAAGRVDEPLVRGFAGVLARFYRDAQPVRVDAGHWRRGLARAILENRDAASNPRFGLPREAARIVCNALIGFLEMHGDLLDARVMGSRIVEGHGDLRPEHVCLEEPPVFIDCLEFNREFRVLDPVDELAYLGLECELLGAGFVGEIALDTYRDVTGDAPDPRLVAFYKAHRAMLRAKLSAWHVLDHEVGEHDRWLRRAARYLELAGRHVQTI